MAKLMIWIALLVFAIVAWFISIRTAKDNSAYPYVVFSCLHTFECKALDADRRMATVCREGRGAPELYELHLSYTDTWAER